MIKWLQTNAMSTRRWWVIVIALWIMIKLNRENERKWKSSKCYILSIKTLDSIKLTCLTILTWHDIQLDVCYWWLISIDTSNRTNNKIFDNDNEKNIDEQMICVQNAKLFENWYVKKQKMMSFCLRTNHRLNDVINC